MPHQPNPILQDIPYLGPTPVCLSTRGKSPGVFGGFQTARTLKANLTIFQKNKAEPNRGVNQLRKGQFEIARKFRSEFQLLTKLDAC